MLELNHVTKRFGRKEILTDLNLKLIDTAGVYGLLGRNGVGKTTLMKLISQLIPSYQGQIRWHGKSVAEYAETLAQITYVNGSTDAKTGYFRQKLKVYLNWYASLYPNFSRALAEQLLARFHLHPKERFDRLSTGNKTLVQNILGLAARTEVLLLDEPTAGLDSVNRELFFQILLEALADHPRLVICSTHLIQEVEPILTHVLLLKDRQIVLDESLEEVQAKAWRVRGGSVSGKRILRREQFAGQNTLLLYDTLAESEQEALRAAGASLEHVGLQSLFNAIVLEEEKV